VGVLRHASALIGVKEDVVNEERGSNKRLIVGGSDLLRGRTGAIKIGNSPKTFINWAEVKVDADLVVLERNKRERKTWVAAEPNWNGT